MPNTSLPEEGRRAKGPIDIGDSFSLIFATPIAVYPWPDSDALNRELRDLILSKEATSIGGERSNVGGWHSSPDLFSWGAPCVLELRDRVMSLLLEMTKATMDNSDTTRSLEHRLDCWANVNRYGNYNNVHNHPNCVWSGCYYVCVGEIEQRGPNNGKLELLDPRSGIRQISLEGITMGQRCLIDPKPGLMVMFPAWLNHLVHPYFGSGERISVAFNVLMRENPPPDMGTY